MSLRAVLENLEGVDAVFHEHYSEKDGKFYLDIEDDIRRHPKGVTLVAALDRTKQEKTTLAEKLAEVEAKLAELPDDFDAEKYAQLMDEEAKRKAKKKGGEDEDEEGRLQVKRLYEQRIQNIETKHVQEKESLEDEKRRLIADIERLVGEEGLTKSLVRAGVDKKLLTGALSMLRRDVKVKVNEDGDWVAYVETDVGETKVDEYVSNWAQSDEGQPYLGKPNGGNAGGNDNTRLGDNPFDNRGGTVKPNLTRQQQLIAANPERARQLAQAAGVTPNW